MKGEASAARAAARAIHEEARRTGANAPAATPNRVAEETTSSPAENVELRADSVREEAAFAPALEGAVPVPDAEVAPKREASPVSSGGEKAAEPVPAPEDPREQIRLRAARLREALATLEKHLETDPAGFWEASPDDRVAYVRYVEPVLAVWRLAGDWLGAPPKRRPPLDPHLYDWDDMTPGLAWAAFSELVGLERMETGAFLRAANSGLVARLLRRILDAPPESWFGEGSSSRTPIA